MNQKTPKFIFLYVLMPMFVVFLGLVFQTELQWLAEITRENLFEIFIVVALCIIMAGMYKLNFQQG